MRVYSGYCILAMLALYCQVNDVKAGYSAMNPRVDTDEEELMRYLFTGYNPTARPVINASHSVNVKIQFALLQIQELNLRKQILYTTGMVIMEWVDERLIWDESEIPIHSLVVESKQVWIPEFAVINAADKIIGDYSHFNAILYSSGKIHWEPGGAFKTTCHIDITYYPFDEQHCKLVFGTWSYVTLKMNMSKLSDALNMDSYEENGEWEITKTESSRREFYFDCCPNDRFAKVGFSIILRRRYSFYIMNIIMPSLMTSVILLTLFFCTPAQKVHIGVLVLLSFRIFLLNVTSSIPKTSDNIPILGIYLTCTMGITTISMVLTVFVLNLHNTKEYPVPEWAYNIFLNYVARLLCMSNHAQPRATLDTTHMELSEKEAHWAKEWRRLAEVLDRVFFWLFLTAIIITTMVLFFPLTRAQFAISRLVVLA